MFGDRTMKAFALVTIVMLATGCGQVAATAHRDRPVATTDDVIADLHALASEHHVGFTNILTRTNMIEFAFTEAAGINPAEGVSVKDHMHAAARKILRKSGWQETRACLLGGLGRSATCRIVATPEGESPRARTRECATADRK